MPDGNLVNVIENKGLKWIFVGGKGGVGKTTISCSVASQMAKNRESVLLISTDPAHNISDSLKQKIGPSPCLVQGFKNFYAMEIDPSIQINKLFGNETIEDGLSGDISSIKNLITMFPGIDEAMTLSETIDLVESNHYSCVVFDTAPTGHTLRFLSFPSALEKTLAKAGDIGSKFKGMFGQLSGIMNMDKDSGNSIEKMLDKLQEIRSKLKRINDEFTDSSKTTFICVCISEFLSLYETERLIQDLAQNDIETHNIVVNQLLALNKDSTCKHCVVRAKMQRKYIEQIYDLYYDFNITEVPLFTEEIRGVETIKQFSKLLLEERKLFGTFTQSQ